MPFSVAIFQTPVLKWWSGTSLDPCTGIPELRKARSMLERANGKIEDPFTAEDVFKNVDRASNLTGGIFSRSVAFERQGCCVPISFKSETASENASICATAERIDKSLPTLVTTGGNPKVIQRLVYLPEKEAHKGQACSPIVRPIRSNLSISTSTVASPNVFSPQVIVPSSSIGNSLNPAAKTAHPRSYPLEFPQQYHMCRLGLLLSWCHCRLRK